MGLRRGATGSAPFFRPYFDIVLSRGFLSVSPFAVTGWLASGVVFDAALESFGPGCVCPLHSSADLPSERQALSACWAVGC